MAETARSIFGNTWAEHAKKSGNELPRRMIVDIRHLYISPGHDFKGRHGEKRMEHEINDQKEIELLAGRGVRGDRYLDHQPDFKGQLTLFAAEVWQKVIENFCA